MNEQMNQIERIERSRDWRPVCLIICCVLWIIADKPFFTPRNSLLSENVIHFGTQCQSHMHQHLFTRTHSHMKGEDLVKN